MWRLQTFTAGRVFELKTGESMFFFQEILLLPLSPYPNKQVKVQEIPAVYIRSKFSNE